MNKKDNVLRLSKANKMSKRLVGFPDSAGQMAQAEAPYGTSKYVGKLPLQAHLQATDLVPQMANAVKRAENNGRNHGVLSVNTANEAEASQVLDNSIYNNFVRWHQAGRPGKFVDFMQQRWAPLGVKNDPHNLNKNWAPNVRKFLQKDPNVDYDMLEVNDIAMSPLGAFTV
jgi:hypothetical protein